MVSRVEAHVVSHYRADRARELGIVLEAILGWRSCITRVVLSSNCDTYETTGFLAPFRERFEAAGHRLELNVVSDLKNPRLLTWEHKKYLPDWLESASPGEDFFLYLEDDIEFTDANLKYFIRSMKALAKDSLIPGFTRYEIKDGERRLVDVTQREFWQRDRSTTVGGVTYHACINPYWAGFILDRDLAREYVKSPSFSLEGSEGVCRWNVQERAAMGLTYERANPKFRTRLVLPIVDGAPDPDCLVWHCSNSYSAEDHPVVARLNVNEAFTRETYPQFLMRKAGGALRRLRR